MEENVIEDIAIKTASEFADSVGIGSVVAQIYALLYVSQEPVSLDEISKKLKLSKSGISQNIRILESWEAVRNVFVKGSRKDFYEANPDVMGIILKRLKNGISSRVNKADKSLSDVESYIGQLTDEEKKKFYQERIESLKKMVRTVSSMVSLLPDKL